MAALLTLTTDFGLRDAYVAALEAAVLRAAPQVQVVHVSHLVPPGDVAAGAYILEYATRSFPVGTVHLIVVDPGVGSDRRMLAVDAGEFVAVGPDNGVLSRALRGRAVNCVALPVPGEASATFQSRDVMAPAAARLASGEPLAVLGPSTELGVDPVAPPLPEAGKLGAPVAHVDGFGTIVIDLTCPVGGGEGRLRVAGREVPFAKTFSGVASGELVAYRGSIGYLEVAIRDGDGARALGLRAGSIVDVEVLA
jgi:S-adenosylmethionine hydrolase